MRLQVCKISGGITNVLLKLSPPEGSQQSAVAMRVFGDKTEDLIDRTRELRILRILNANGFGAPVSYCWPYEPTLHSRVSHLFRFLEYRMCERWASQG
jgi:thiamine kinase-like enzyme